MKKAIWKFLNGSNLGPWLQIGVKSALKENGWFLSFKTKTSVDQSGNPIPWYPYSMIAFLKERMTSELTVFEYGAGNSTLWYASKVKEVYAVESDQQWMQLLSPRLPKNAKVIFEDVESPAYIKKAVDLNIKFSVIVVDGRRRVACIESCIPALTDDGVIILDNSDRDIYQAGRLLLVSLNFKELKITGMPPIIPMDSSTSVFYRNNNCLGI